MTSDIMTPMQRVLTTLGHNEPDRVPFFLLNNLHGARLLDVSIQEYFQRPDWVAEAQIRLQDHYRDDCYYSFFYAPLEVEAFGGEVVFVENGPPNSGQPVIARPKDIDSLEAPRVSESSVLQRVLETTRRLLEAAGDRIPIIGVVMSPFSLPVMQMGFDHYLNLLYEDSERFQRLMAINQEFCVQWANAQLQAGATAICYFDPVSSPTMIPPDLYQTTGHLIARDTLARIEGPTASHFASGRVLPIAEDILTTGTQVVGVGHTEDLVELKRAFRGQATLLGNLNGIEMMSWSKAETQDHVRHALRAGTGGGFILSDNHGEIPWQVPTSVLEDLSDAVHRFGHYPLKEGSLHG